MLVFMWLVLNVSRLDETVGACMVLPETGRGMFHDAGASGKPGDVFPVIAAPINGSRRCQGQA